MGITKNIVGFHDQMVANSWEEVVPSQGGSRFTYTFRNFFHPFVGELIARLNQESLRGVLDPVWQDSLKTADPESDPAQDFFRLLYRPQGTDLVRVESSRKEFDLTAYGPYANYNWELFFHIPLTVAVHLSKTRRFAEAQRWFHYVFDPTSNDKTVDPPGRFWNFLAFRRDRDPKQIDALLTLLSKPPAELSPDDQQLQSDILNGYRAVLAKPFQPHAVARTRHLAYQYSVVMKYLDNLIAWGDDLFQRDTVESINEATQLYVLAANLLGPRPERVPPRGTVRPMTFAQLKARGLDEMGNALVELEGKFPFNLGSTAPASSAGEGEGVGPLFGLGRTLYFCVPRNDKLLGYWDTVADRLFKIRHCQNIQGVVRPLALFDPPIDPGLFVKAAAAGLDLSHAVSGLSQPVGPLRCLTLIQKALELCAEVRVLGGALLAALEKGDAEHLALVRQRHETQVQQLAQEVRFLQWKHAQESTQSLLTARAAGLERLLYYRRLLGLPADQNAPDSLPLDRRRLTEGNFDDAYEALVGQYDRPLTMQAMPALKIAGDSSPSNQSGATGQGKLYLNTNEEMGLNKHADNALEFKKAAAATEVIAGVLALIPTLHLKASFWGVGPDTRVGGGDPLSSSSRAVSSGLGIKSQSEELQGEKSAKTGEYERRADEWLLQYNLAARELMQIGRQLLTSLIAEQVAYHEYQSLQRQVGNAREVDQFLHDKFTNEDLFLWMQGEISRLYYEYYRFAFDTARQAERTMKHELMRPEVDAQDFVKFNYWDGGRKGLLAGEALFLDLKRLEMAYHTNNKRELELTRHVSLRQLDPLALLSLRASGACTLTVPEWLYDRDCPGHYLRRIKSVALSIPSVVGPYTSVNCTLSLLRSSLRKSAALTDGEYARQGADDDRFVDYAGAVQSIVTSGAVADSGLFETSLRDERFLPFEGAGAESAWKLELPRDYPAFDYETIADVILHIRYTARPGVDVAKVKAALKDHFEQAGPGPLVQLFSLRHEFPSEWHRFVTSPNSDSTALAVGLEVTRFPYFAQNREITVKKATVIARPEPASTVRVGIAPGGAITDPAEATSPWTGEEKPGLWTVVTDADPQRFKDLFVVFEYSVS